MEKILLKKSFRVKDLKIINFNPLIGILSVITSFVQFLGYGTGYIYSQFK